MRIENGTAKPYDDDECRHNLRFEVDGVLTCRECGATYNDAILEWGDA